ncbi:TonB-dependent receptor [Methylosinus sporium]|uniref:TonB-dependent receptor n=1 Tax=Methylosinus sporium TaxID=428 RepID=A0A549SXN1_METSR|nr:MULTISPECIES: TonB-dependent receptor [Methylosinus]MBU3889403.1 TonB-dependent receptor [Methylosinus sp. KRF6]TRL34393.1 TonB-dependent receptor [Methylosinus sporium]
MHRHHLLRGVSAGALFIVCSAALPPARAQEALPTIDIAGDGRPTQSRPAPASVWSPTLPDGKPAFVQKFALPNTVASITRKQIDETINVIDTEDVVKYLPSLFVRKRNNGDTQAVLQTRTWGVSSSARSLVYADDLLLTALIGNDNSIGAPRWGLVAPEEIERVDMLYGPFSAQYPGNSMGGVLQITTRMPDKLEVTAKQSVSLQDFSLYGTSKLFHTEVTSASVGDKIGDFSWFLTGNYAHGTTQPLTYVTSSSLYGWPGAYFSNTKSGGPATVLGSSGNLENDQVNAKLKLAYDFSPTIRATYTLGFWSNDGTSIPQSYVSGGLQAFGATSGTGSIGSAAMQSFGSGYYRVQEKMLTNALAVKSNTGGPFDFEISASHFTYLQSDQRSPYTAAPVGYSSTGKDVRYNGTYWTLLDLKGILRPDGVLAGHDISFGLHGDQFHLNNPTWLTTNWTSGMASSYGVAASIGQGTTRTQALWAQDAWRISKEFKFTVGGRWEHWVASDGYNQSLGSINANGFGSTATALSMLPTYQPVLNHTRFSPKGSLQWTPDEDWTITGSIGLANRFPTAKELYNLTTIAGASGTLVNPNPNLRPEVALSKELAVERKIGADGSVRISLFDEEVRDAIISQSTFVTGQNFTASQTTNVDRVRNSGVEVAARKDNVLVQGLELVGSATYLNARVISDSKWAPSGGTNYDNWALSVAGKRVPNVPDWRATMQATYRPDDHWAFTVAARYQGQMWTTLANNDIAHGVYQSFDRFFVVDTKIHYKWNKHISFDFGVDNIGNYKYFLFHPFPQRTYTMSAKYEFGREKGERGIFFEGDEPPLFDVSFVK